MKRLVIGILLVSAGCSKPTVEEHVAKADTYVAASQMNEAIVEYKSALAIDPKRGDVHAKLGEAHAKVGDMRGTYVEFIRAADLLPNDVNAQIRAGNVLLLARRFEDARSRAEKALALDPKSIEATILKGNALAGLKDFDGAVKEYQEAIALSTQADSAYNNLGSVQLVQGQLATAEATFKKAIEAAPKSVVARMALANLYIATRRSKEAETLLKEAVSLEPSHLAANRALGVFYLASGRSPEAEPYFQAIAKAANTPEARMSLSDYYIFMRRTDDARKVLEELAKEKQGFAPATTRLAALQAEEKNITTARTLVDSVLQKQPKYVPARALELRLLMAAEKQDEARKKALALIQDEPDSPAAAEAQMAIGLIDVWNDRTEDALKAFADALRIQPKSLPATLALARGHLSVLDFDKAEAYAQQALSLAPQNPDARTISIRVDMARGNAVRADKELARLQKDYPHAVAVSNLVAAQHLFAGRLEEARRAYTASITALPSDHEALEGLVTVNIRMGRKEDAVKRMEDALNSRPPSAQLYTLAGRVYSETGNAQRAEEMLRKSIDAEPHRLTAYGLLGQLYIQQKRLADAKDQYEELVKRNPKSVSANTMLGMLMEALRDSAAEAQYQKTLAIDPEAPIAANNLAWIYVSSNRNLDQALQLAQTALRKQPDSPQVNDTLGWIYYKKGLFSQSVRHLELSVQKNPSAGAHYHLGMAYSQVGDIDKARRSLEKALALSQTFDGAEEAKKTLAGLGK